MSAEHTSNDADGGNSLFITITSHAENDGFSIRKKLKSVVGDDYSYLVPPTFPPNYALLVQSANFPAVLSRKMRSK